MTVYWSSTDVAHGLSLINGEYKFTGKPFTALFHEFSHAIDKLTGDYDSGIWFENKGVTIKNNEQVACFRENLIRKEQGLPRRDFYGVIQNGTSVRPILMSFIKDRPIDVIKFNIYYNLYKLCQKVLFFSR